MKAFALTLLSATLLTACGNGSEAQPVNTPAAPSAALQALLPTLSGAHVWDVDPQASQLTFTAVHNNDAFIGDFGQFDAAIKLDPNAPETGEIHAVVSIATVDAKDEDRTANLPSADWFDLKTYAYATYDSEQISKQADGTYLSQGTLTLKGVSKEIPLTFTLDIVDGVATAKGGTSFSRTAFNIGQGSDFTDESWVKFPVEVNFVIQAKKNAR